MKIMVLQSLDHGYDPYNPRALVEVEAESEDEACDRLEAAIEESRRARAAKALSLSGRQREQQRRKQAA